MWGIFGREAGLFVFRRRKSTGGVIVRAILQKVGRKFLISIEFKRPIRRQKYRSFEQLNDKENADTGFFKTKEIRTTSLIFI